MVKLFISLSSNVFVHWWSLSTSIISLGAVKWHCLACPFLSRLSGRIPVSFWQPECVHGTLCGCSKWLFPQLKFNPKRLTSKKKKKEFATEEIPWNYLWLQNQVCKGISKITVMLSIWNVSPRHLLKVWCPVQWSEAGHQRYGWIMRAPA